MADPSLRMALNKVLLVDDEPDIRRIGQIGLELVGKWIVVQAHNGIQALALAASELPDVILLDVMMPDLDGPSTFVRLRDNPATTHIPVIFITAKAQVDEVASYRALGAAGVIAKPFDPMTLPSEMRSIIDGLGR